jgi:hypothetical protein
MTSDNLITHRCRFCGEPVDVDLVETTGLVDLARRVRTYTWGRWEKCGECGSTEHPGLVIDDTSLLTQPFESDYSVLPINPDDPRWEGAWQR